MDGFLRRLIIFCSEIACGDDARAEGDPVKKSHHQKNKASGGADSGKRLAAEKISDDQRIRRIIKLLKQISEKQREGKRDDPLRDRALCQQCLMLLVMVYVNM